MLARTLCVAATIATLGFAAPALAGEGSPDIDRGTNAPSYGYGESYGWPAPAPSYSYEVEPSQGYVVTPSDPDTGYAVPDDDDMDDAEE
jgi:hypothetical protein